MSETPSFQSAATLLFREAFEGIPPRQDYTWFVQGKEGLFDAFRTVDAERASRKLAPSSPSIAAHAYHILFTLRNANSYQGRPEPEGTWESSWEKQIATEAEWAELVQRIRDEYTLFLGWLESQTGWRDQTTVIGVLAQLPHMAYHLGAIRQLIGLTAAP